MKIGAIGVLIGFLSVIMTAQVGGEEVNSEQSQPNYWMQKKLELSQAILADLATADFDAIVRNSRKMKNLSTLEGWARRSDAAWQLR